jgi:hypothetical protein
MLNLKKLRNTRTAAAWRCMHRNYRREGQASQKLTSALSRHFRAVSDIAGERRERKGTVWHKRSNICGGVVQLVRTPVTQEAAGSSPVAPANSTALPASVLWVHRETVFLWLMFQMPQCFADQLGGAFDIRVCNV